MSGGKIQDILKAIGITRKYKGYYFLIDATEIIIHDESALLNINRRIYKPISRKYRCNTATVERNIRTIILKVWKDNKPGIENITNTKFASPPTVSDFIDSLAYCVNNLENDR